MKRPFERKLQLQMSWSFKGGDFVRIKIMLTEDERRKAKGPGYEAMWTPAHDEAGGKVGAVLYEDHMTHKGCVWVRFILNSGVCLTSLFNKGWLIAIAYPRSEVDDETAEKLGFPFTDALRKTKIVEIMSEIDRTEKEMVELFKKLRRPTEDALK